jgi:hypothetical protein
MTPGKVNSRGVSVGVICVANGVIAAVGTVDVVHSLSSSGQSSKPSHQDVTLIQMLLVGQRTVPGGHGLQVQPHEGVSTLCRFYSKEKLSSLFSFFCQFSSNIYHQENKSMLIPKPEIK